MSSAKAFCSYSFLNCSSTCATNSSAGRFNLKKRRTIPVSVASCAFPRSTLMMKRKGNPDAALSCVRDIFCCSRNRLTTTLKARGRCGYSIPALRIASASSIDKPPSRRSLRRASPKGLFDGLVSWIIGRVFLANGGRSFRHPSLTRDTPGRRFFSLLSYGWLRRDGLYLEGIAAA